MVKIILIVEKTSIKYSGSSYQNISTFFCIGPRPTKSIDKFIFDRKQNKEKIVVMQTVQVNCIDRNQNKLLTNASGRADLVL